MNMRRNRKTYCVLILLTIILGLCARRYSGSLSNWLSAYSGDTLWALMVFLMTGFLFTGMKTRHVAMISIIFSFIIEISQLHHAPWIDAIRKTTIGSLVLGYGFLWSDLICYTAGVVLGVLLEMHLAIDWTKK